MDNGNNPFFGGANDREAFFSLFYEEEGFLFDLERSARSRKVPIIRKEMAQFLQLLLHIKKPEKVLEVGTAIGYSALLISKFLPEQGKLVTIERNPVMWQEARMRLQEAQEAVSKEKDKPAARQLQPAKIEMKIGDAADLLPKLEEGYDFIFLDSAKAQYIHFLQDLVRLLNPGGLLVTDNVLQNGEIMRSRHLLIRRERTTHRRMRQYLKEISNHPALQTYYFGMADGVTVCIKTEDRNSCCKEKRNK